MSNNLPLDRCPQKRPIEERTEREISTHSVSGPRNRKKMAQIHLDPTLVDSFEGVVLLWSIGSICTITKEGGERGGEGGLAGKSGSLEESFFVKGKGEDSSSGR